MTNQVNIQELLNDIAFHATGGIDDIIQDGKVPVITVLIDQFRPHIEALEADRKRLRAICDALDKAIDDICSDCDAGDRGDCEWSPNGCAETEQFESILAMKESTDEQKP